MNTLYLISCVSKKQPYETVNGLSKLYPAGELYLSDWFIKAKAYVTQPAELDTDLVAGRRCWGILSALHGFVEPTDLIAPYNVTLVQADKPARFYWAKKVMTRLTKFIEANDVKRVVIFAGVNYRTPLVGLLDEFFGVDEYAVMTPLWNKGIGAQKSFFKKGTPAR